MRSSGDNVTHKDEPRGKSVFVSTIRDWVQGLDGMANTGELLINVVKKNKRTRADGVWPKGKGSGRSAHKSGLADNTVPGGEAEPNPSGHSDETGQTRIPPLTPFWGRRVVRLADGCAGRGSPRKRMPGCNDRGSGALPRRESVLTSDRFFVTKTYEDAYTNKQCEP